MPAIILRCPGCNARIKAPLNLLGRWRVCPGCNTRFIVRNEAKSKPVDAQPVLVADYQPLSRPFAIARGW